MVNWWSKVFFDHIMALKGLKNKAIFAETEQGLRIYGRDHEDVIVGNGVYGIREMK